MNKHATATRTEWLKARRDLLKAEKELTLQGDKVAEGRRALPWVRVEKEYQFDTDEGMATLKGLFRGRSQLLVYHFMFGPEYESGCASCSSIADGFNGSAVHLLNHGVSFMAVSLAPLPKLQAYKQRMGWTFPWASSAGSDFNYDFNVSFTEKQQREGKVEYNYEPMDMRPVLEGKADFAKLMAEMSGVDAGTFLRQLPGMSAFVLKDGAVYHSYSAYARGVDGVWGMYSWLDRTPLGRNESGAEPWVRHHDKYQDR